MKELKSVILKELEHISLDYPNLRFGLAGSYARGEETSSSDVDIVVDTDMLTIEQIDNIKERFNMDVDVVQLKLLENEDMQLDKFSVEHNLPINEDSAYKSISREVIWV